jgi:hypothetical protein
MPPSAYAAQDRFGLTPAPFGVVYAPAQLLAMEFMVSASVRISAGSTTEAR